MNTIDISSPESRTFRRFLKLTRVRGVKEQGMALLSGPRQVREVIEEFPDRCAAVVLSGDQPLPARAAANRIKGYRLSPGLFQRLDLFGTGHPLLVVRFEEFPPFSTERSVSGCSLCIPFQDPANVGSMIRTAAGLGVSRLILLREAAHPFHPRSVRVAGSSIFRVPMVSGPSLNDLTLSAGPMITLSPEGKDIGLYRFPSSFCLVPGLEGPGLPGRLKRGVSLSIPMKNGVESLNAAVAAGIALYVWQRGRRCNNHAGGQDNER